eukprot:4385907-Lingulodinium_polyedra.AAC.1
MGPGGVQNGPSERTQRHQAPPACVRNGTRERAKRPQATPPNCVQNGRWLRTKRPQGARETASGTPAIAYKMAFVC